MAFYSPPYEVNVLFVVFENSYLLDRGADITLYVWVANNVSILFVILKDSYLLDKDADKTLYV